MLPVIDEFSDYLAQNGVEIVLTDVEERLEEDQLLVIIEDIDGVICGDDRFTAKVIENAPRLKVISKWGTGIDSIDVEACQSHGVEVCNTPNAFSKPVADSVLGYMLAFARNIPWMDSQMKQGSWEKIPGHALHERTLGVIGVGNVGRAVIERASAFGINILGNDPILPPDEFIDKYGVQMVSQKELLEQSDYISINCDLNPTSYHLMDQEAFKLMRPNAVLINAARGPIVKETALIEALTSKLIAGAGLDVFEFEPLPQDSPLLSMDNVLIAPHNSNSSPTAWQHVHENTIKNLLDVLHNKKR